MNRFLTPDQRSEIRSFLPQVELINQLSQDETGQKMDELVGEMQSFDFGGLEKLLHNLLES